MMRSLYSGVAGLKVHQTKMDVIGNNIANVNTVGYKAQSVTFSELFYQTTQIATGANEQTNTGGQNAKQIGLGSQVSSVAIDITGQGGSQSTGRAFDLMINGSSFFVVNKGGNNYFTKAGNFTTDADGNLVTTSGYYVMGYSATGVGEDLQTDKVRRLSVYSDLYETAPPSATTGITVAGNIDSELAANGSITRIMYTYDNLGTMYGVQMTYTPTGDPGKYTLKVGDVYKGSEVVSGTGGIEAKLNGAASVEVEYDPATGVFKSVTGSVPYADGSGMTGTDPTKTTLTLSGLDSFKEIDPATGLPTTNDRNIILDFSGTTSYAGDSTIDSTRGLATDGKVTGAGMATGKMISVGVQTDGSIVASYSNGDTYIIGQIAVATFANAAGLQKEGDNLFSATLNSGDFNGIGNTLSEVGESVSSGVVEMSNVDLAKEFTEMITTQRGFQANSRIITTSDTMLEELINLKR